MGTEYLDNQTTKKQTVLPKELGQIGTVTCFVSSGSATGYLWPISLRDIDFQSPPSLKPKHHAEIAYPTFHFSPWGLNLLPKASAQSRMPQTQKGTLSNLNPLNLGLCRVYRDYIRIMEKNIGNYNLGFKVLLH